MRTPDGFGPGSAPSRRTSTSDTDFDADFELPKNGKRETVAMIISSRYTAQGQR